MAKPKKTAEPKIIRPDDIDPHHDWKRPLHAPGHTQVDFEERINFRRLHDYRLARVRAALAASGLGALLSFDQHNIRYTTSTVIGEWARDKLTRYSLLTGNGDPYIWDFGSAAQHHRLYAPWLRVDHCKAGLLGLRGAVGSDITLFREAAKEIKAILDSEGVGDMPLGLDVVEPAHLHRSPHPARRPGVLRRHPVVYGLSYLLLPDVQCGPRDGAAKDGVQESARVDRQGNRAAEARHDERQDRARFPRGEGD